MKPLAVILSPRTIRHRSIVGVHNRVGQQNGRQSRGGARLRQLVLTLDRRSHVDFHRPRTRISRQPEDKLEEVSIGTKLARLLKEDDNACDARHEAHSIAPQSGGSRRPEDYSAAASRT